MPVELTVDDVPEPQQQRSRQKQQRIFRAADELFTERGFKETSVQEIAARADVAVGTFYQRFKNKDALLLAMFVAFEEETVERSRQWYEEITSADVPLVEIVRSLVRLTMDLYAERAGLLRSLIVSSDRYPEIHERASRLFARSSKLFARCLVESPEAIDHPSPDRAADFAMRQLFAFLDQSLIHPNRPPTRYSFSRRETEQELARSILAYLGAAT